MKMIVSTLIVGLLIIVLTILINETNHGISDNSIEQVNIKSTKVETKDREYYMDLMVVGQLACQNYLKSKATNPNSLKFKYRINNSHDKNANNELSLPYEIVVDEISEGVNDVYIYGTLTGDNSFGGKVQQNFTCQVRVDKPNDKFYVINSIIDNSY